VKNFLKKYFFSFLLSWDLSGGNPIFLEFCKYDFVRELSPLTDIFLERNPANSNRIHYWKEKHAKNVNSIFDQ
jgi:hypothetical protein